MKCPLLKIPFAFTELRLPTGEWMVMLFRLPIGAARPRVTPGKGEVGDWFAMALDPDHLVNPPFQSLQSLEIIGG